MVFATSPKICFMEGLWVLRIVGSTAGGVKKLTLCNERFEFLRTRIRLYSHLENLIRFGIRILRRRLSRIYRLQPSSGIHRLHPLLVRWIVRMASLMALFKVLPADKVKLICKFSPLMEVELPQPVFLLISFSLCLTRENIKKLM